jgi:ribosome-associated toxin RatA of RatAB toxin-antitoxin module
MASLKFTSVVEVPIEHLLKICTDYEKFPNYLPRQLKTMKIIESNNGTITTEDTIVFSSVVKNTIHQQSIHQQISQNEISNRIISGPAKETTINLILEKNGTKTKINLNIELKLSFKAKFLEPIVRLWYKRVITSILFTVSNEFIQQQKMLSENL